MIAVLSSVGMKGALEQLNAPGCRITYGTMVPLMRRIEAGERFDVAILAPAMIESLAARGEVDGAQLLARSCMGVGVAKGAPRPELGCVESFKRAQLGARAIAYSKEGQSGLYMAALIERLGLAAELAPKTVLETRPGGAAFNLAEGRAELALTIMSEIVPVPGAELAGPLPREIAHCVLFAAGISRQADRRAAQAFIDSVKSSPALEALRANAMEPA